MLEIILILIGLIVLGILAFNLVWPNIRAEKRQTFITNMISRDRNIHDMILTIHSLDGERVFSSNKGKLDENTEFAIASISKLYTHALVFQLIDEGRLSYETKLSEVLPEDTLKGLYVKNEKDTSGELTIRQLIDQTSGLADYETDRMPGGRIVMEEVIKQDVSIGFDEALALNKQLAPRSVPGVKAHYSNINAMLLGRAVEVMTGEPLADTYRARIFSPLKLEHTRASTNNDVYADIYNGELAIKRPMYIKSGLAAGGIVSTNHELWLFMKAFFSGELFERSHISKPVFKKIQFPTVKYGSGMMSVGVPRLASPLFPAPTIIGHSGSTGSFAYYYPTKNFVITGTVNQIKSRPYQYIYLYLSTL